VDIRTEEVGNVRVLRINGEVRGLSAELLRKEIEFEISIGTKKLLIDLGAVPHVDSTGFGALLKGVAAIRSSRGDLALFGLQDEVRRVMKIANLGSHITIFDSQDAALETFA